jgi:ComF family protein
VLPLALRGLGLPEAAGVRARAAVAYGGAVTQALLRFKHGGRRDLAAPLGRLMAPLFKDTLRAAGPGLGPIDAVLPVPLHLRRLRSRGYNQALELARAARGGAPVPLWVDTLRRVRDTPPLGRESPESRRRLVAGAFAVPRPSRVDGRHVLLVDDVLTTGATIEACAAALHTAGARAVSAVCLSQVL